MKKLIVFFLVALFFGFSAIAQTTIYLKSVTLTQYPNVDKNGNSWDSFGGRADVYYVLSNEIGNAVYSAKANFAKDLYHLTSVTWQPNIMITSDEIWFNFFDNDLNSIGDSDTFIGKVGVDIMKLLKTRQKTVSLDNNEGLKVTLEFSFL